MGHQQEHKGHVTHIQNTHGKQAYNNDFVLEKSIFNNIFEKDIKRVFIYKKAERLAKALHLITPAFAESASLRNRIDAIACSLIDAAVLPPGVARTALSRELLSLSSVLAIARTGSLLSEMNADLISREAHMLLQEIAAYEEPRLFLDEAPTLSSIAKDTLKKDPEETRTTVQKHVPQRQKIVALGAQNDKGQIKDRQETILSVIRNKGSVGIKDISTLIRGVSEKTIQRELAALVGTGIVKKEGERRWSVYSIV